MIDFNLQSPTKMNRPTFGDFLSSTSTAEKCIKNKNECFRKWHPVLLNFFEDYNISKESYINLSVYVEIYSIYESNLVSFGHKTTNESYLTSEINRIKSELDKPEIRRSIVKSKVYNYQTGKMEYELEDGNFIEISDVKVKGPYLEISDVYEKEFIKHMDISKYRDMKIDDIL